MPSASRSVFAALLVVAAVLLAPAAASAAHTGHIDLRDGLTLAQQFGYTPDYRQHVVTFGPGNVPTIRSRGANEDDTSFVHRLEGGAWVRHDLLECTARRLSGFRRHRARRRLRHRPRGLGRRRTRLHRAHHPPRRRRRVPQRAHGVGRRHGDLAGRRAPLRRVHPADRPARLGQRHDRAPGRTAARGAAARGRLAAARPLEGPVGGPQPAPGHQAVLERRHAPAAQAGHRERRRPRPAPVLGRRIVRGHPRRHQLLRLLDHGPARHHLHAHLRRRLQRVRATP